MSDIAIKAEGLSKYYKLGVINNGTFFKDVQTWMARKTGKEDPNAKIGSKYDPTAEGFWALKDLNFEIKQGDRVGIIGKNGAGKSTLLKVLSRVTAPTEGDVKIKGRIASLLEVGTGFHPELTGRENIYLNGAILGMKRREVDRKIDEIIAFSEIEKHIDTPVKRYSSGMYVRLAFAVAAHLDSEILIADEVLAVGDAAFQKKALGKMNELSTGQGRTVLFVSHNMSQVKSLCNKGLVLDHGSIAFKGDIEEAKNYYLGNHIYNKQIIDFMKIKSPELDITSVKVNNSTSNEVMVPLNTENIDIEIEGTSSVCKMADVMLVFKNSDYVPLATFSLGHYRGKMIEIPEGNFKLKYTINLPENVGRGECFASLYIHRPGIEGIVDFENALVFTFEGNRAEFGNALAINENGMIGLDGIIRN